MKYEMTKTEKRKKRTKLQKIRTFVISILIFIIILFLFAVSVRSFGKISLQKKADQEMKMVSKEEIISQETEEGIVYFEGEKYRYNENILTFLFMGIDSEESFEESEQMGKAGQSDCIFLAVMDTKNKMLKFIGISRDTITDITIYDENGEYVRTVPEHLAIQYAYGDGSKKSCDLMVNAVSNLMYGLPIHGYCAINLDGIAVLNDTVGGVEIFVKEDIDDKKGVRLKKGDTLTLKGQQAMAYVRYRGKDFASNNRRIERQKQYLKAFADTLIIQTKKDITVPKKVIQNMKDYMITDISLDQITYLASELLNYSIDLDNIRSVKGEVIQPEDSRYEQFHVDYDTLYEMILEIFYEKDIGA